MFKDYIRENKKTLTVVGIAVVILIGLMFVLGTLFQPASHEGEEQEPETGLYVTNLSVLYDNFSDTTIGYILNTISTAISTNQSLRNGSPISADATPIPSATDNDLYPAVNISKTTITIDGDKVTDIEDSWGMWKSFEFTSDTKIRFKVNVSLGAHNRENDLSYTQIHVTKL